MPRKLYLTLTLAAGTLLLFWYGARAPKTSNPQVIPEKAPGAVQPTPLTQPVPAVSAAPVVQAPESKPREPMPTINATGQVTVNPMVTPPQRQGLMADEESPAKVEADAIALNIRHYSQRFGGNPVGSNAEIVKAMMGGNTGGATYLPADLQRLNERGEVTDTWGTPYFFHQNSADHMEVRSAGPDKKLWTSDDIKTR